ncbi:MAG: hypothetical protein SAJ12_18690 [Jaaginema sp. PMC 1079.18]|nr:hypothetical protein [Jaaginema sp. PMC 1080.18]MEC4853014.1 hypothetical protein [Jaaginema sp. PMC 1079.18]MEC4866244.1 hypothetical protein [Jaaginema sp. PMC 1078.18]
MNRYRRIAAKILLCVSQQSFLEPLVEKIITDCFSFLTDYEVIPYDYSSLITLEFADIAAVQPHLILLILSKRESENELETYLFEYNSMKSLFEKVRDNSQIPIVIISTDECLFFRPAFTDKQKYFSSTVISPYFEPQNYIFSSNLPQNTPIDVHFSIPLHWSEFVKTVRNFLT